jgi:hypothetical protein
MRSQTIISLTWRISGRTEVFVNLGKLFSKYDSDSLGVSRYTLDRKNLFEGYQNDTIQLVKILVK